MRKVYVVCPICAARKKVPVSPDALDYERGSLLYWEISPNMVCEHHFFVLMDYHFKIRDYELFYHEMPLCIQKKGHLFD